MVGGSGDRLVLYLVKCLEICLFEITIFEVDASAVKAQVRHLNYKKEKKKKTTCQCLHYKVLYPLVLFYFYLISSEF